MNAQFKIDSHVKPPRIRKPKSQRVPESATKQMKAYQEAFKAVYGITPTLTYVHGTKYVDDGKQAVSVKRMKELTRMLRQRIG